MVRYNTDQFEAEFNQAASEDYNIFGSSCVDLPQEAFEAVVVYRKNVQSKRDPYFWSKKLSYNDASNKGFHLLTPNDWYNALIQNQIFTNFVRNINQDLQKPFKIEECSDLIHANPRDH